MTEQEITEKLAACTTMKDGRSLDEWNAIRGLNNLAPPHKMPVLDPALVEAGAALLARTPVADRLALIKRLVDTLPYDVLQVLNQAWTKLDTYNTAIREMHEAREAKPGG